MAYDRFGRTPTQARRDRIHDWFCVAGLLVILAGCATFCTLVFMLLSEMIGA